MAYPTRSALVAASSVEELTSLTLEQQDALRTVAIAGVEFFTGQRFEPEIGQERIDGHGGDELYLPRRVEVLTGVTVAGASIALGDVVLGPNGDRLHFRRDAGLGYYEQAMASLHGADTRTFRSGPGTILVSGTFGWSECPAAVEQAIRLDMEEQAQADASKLAGITASARRMGLRELTQGNLRLSIGVAGGMSLRIQELLVPLQWKGPQGWRV